MSVYDLNKPSPDGRRMAQFLWQDEYSQGNFTYALVLDGIALAGRDFLESCAWSGEGRYFAVAEIPAGTNPRDGLFAALVIDLEQKRGCLVTHREGLLPQRFAGPQLVCRGWQSGAEWSFDLNNLSVWQQL